MIIPFYKYNSDLAESRKLLYLRYMNRFVPKSAKMAVLVVFCCVTFGSAAQPYLTDSSQWYSVRKQVMFNPTISQYAFTYTHRYFYVKGDTLINNLTYKKIVQLNKYCGFQIQGPNQPTPCPSEPFIGGNLTLMREAGQTWYHWNGIKDTVLYRFNMAKGDTFYYNPWIPGGALIVDTVLQNYNNTGRKLFQLKDPMFPNAPPSNNYSGIIEGVGPTCGFLSWLFFPFETDESLVCYSALPTSSYGCLSNLFVGMNELGMDRNKAKLFPNPAGQTLMIDAPDFSTGARLIIYDALGKAVLREENFSGQNTIDISLLAQGLYLAEIKSGAQSKTFKFIKE
jgi:hypothetical protein